MIRDDSRTISSNFAVVVPFAVSHVNYAVHGGIPFVHNSWAVPAATPAIRSSSLQKAQP
jgi:hypothetical protein